MTDSTKPSGRPVGRPDGGARVEVVRDREIVELLIAGDVRGLAAAHELYADRLYTYARWTLRGADPAAAADVVQDTLLVAFGKAGQLRDPELLRPWLYAVARNECLRVLRGRARTAPLPEDDVGLPEDRILGADEPALGVRRDEARDLVHAAAAGLSPKDREVFELGLRHGLVAAEVGRVLGVGENQAHAVLSRVRAQLGKAIGALLVARHGRADCADLDATLRGWDGTFDPLWRKRIARHVEGCATCSATRDRRAGAPALLGVLPIALAPLFLARRARAAELDPDLVAHATRLGARAEPFDADGFPVPSEPYVPDGSGPADTPVPPPRKRRRRTAWALGLLLLLGLGAGVPALLAEDSRSGEVLPILATPSFTGSPTADPTAQGSAVPPAVTPAEPAPTVPAVAPSVSASITATPEPTPEATRPATPRPTSTATRRPSGTVQVVPGTVVLAPGSATTVRLVAVDGPVEWWAVVLGEQPRRVGLSATSGSLDAGQAISLQVRISAATPRNVRSFVVEFSPGGARLSITVAHPQTAR